MNIDELEKAGHEVMISGGKQYIKGVALRTLRPVRKIFPGEIAIIIDDDTTIENVKAVWSSVVKLRTILRRQNGKEFLKISNYLKLGCKVKYHETSS